MAFLSAFHPCFVKVNGYIFKSLVLAYYVNSHNKNIPRGIVPLNTLKINRIIIFLFSTLCGNTTISFHNFVELIPVFKIYLYLCRIDYSLNNIITMKKDITECSHWHLLHAWLFMRKIKIKTQTSPMSSSFMLMI